MADIYFKCGNCENKLVVEDSAIGMELDCPGCETVIVVPTPDIFFACELCGTEISAPENMIGDHVVCQGCRADLLVPADEDEEGDLPEEFPDDRGLEDPSVIPEEIEETSTSLPVESSKEEKANIFQSYRDEHGVDASVRTNLGRLLQTAEETSHGKGRNLRLISSALLVSAAIFCAVIGWLATSLSGRAGWLEIILFVLTVGLMTAGFVILKKPAKRRG